MIEIKHRFTDILLCAFDESSLKTAVERACKEGADLRGANLCGANLCGANLRGANLRGANLHGADLYGANLYGANLYGANLRGANLRGADLYGANLYGANLYGADLRGANLRGADLYGADLYGADLYGADLRGANLHGADLYGADLYGAKNLSSLVISQNSICPQGQLIVFKKLKDGIIAKIAIPQDAKRLNSIGSRKCRASYALVLSLSSGEVGYDQHTGKTKYKAGEFVYPDKFDENIYTECSHGIHFFLTEEEAKAY